MWWWSWRIKLKRTKWKRKRKRSSKQKRRKREGRVNFNSAESSFKYLLQPRPLFSLFPRNRWLHPATSTTIISTSELLCFFLGFFSLHFPYFQGAVNIFLPTFFSTAAAFPKFGCVAWKSVLDVIISHSDFILFSPIDNTCWMPPFKMLCASHIKRSSCSSRRLIWQTDLLPQQVTCQAGTHQFPSIATEKLRKSIRRNGDEMPTIHIRTCERASEQWVNPRTKSEGRLQLGWVRERGTDGGETNNVWLGITTLTSHRASSPVGKLHRSWFSCIAFLPKWRNKARLERTLLHDFFFILPGLSSL